MTRKSLPPVVLVLVAVFGVLRFATWAMRSHVEEEKRHWAKAVDHIDHSAEAACGVDCYDLRRRQDRSAAGILDGDQSVCEEMCMTSLKKHWGDTFNESYLACRGPCLERRDDGGVRACLAECVETHMRTPAPPPNLPPEIMEQQKVIQQQVNRLRQEVGALDGG
jgi:hypothetical protein